MIIDYLKESLYDEDIGKLENYIKSICTRSFVRC